MNNLLLFSIVVVFILKFDYIDLWGLKCSGNLIIDNDNMLNNNISFDLSRKFNATGNNNSNKAWYAIFSDINRARYIEKIELEYIIQNNLSDQEIGKKLLNQLQCDLLPALQGSILESKYNRDHPMKQKISIYYKIYGCLIILLLNGWCLFYIIKFTFHLSNDHQKAWFFSLLLWLFIEIFFVSTNLVLFNHLVIPSLTMKDVNIVKIKMIEIISKYYERKQQHSGQ